MTVRHPVRFSPAVVALLKRVRDAKCLTLSAQEAYLASDRVDGLLAAAERAHVSLIRDLCGVTDEEADLIEPAFTEFESSLLQLLRRLPS